MDEDEDVEEVKFINDVNINFNEDVSVKTTRINDNAKNQAMATTSSSPVRKPNISILKLPSGGCSINLAITIGTRMTTPETTLDRILNFVETNQPEKVSSDQDNISMLLPRILLQLQRHFFWMERLVNSVVITITGHE